MSLPAVRSFASEGHQEASLSGHYNLRVDTLLSSTADIKLQLNPALCSAFKVKLSDCHAGQFSAAARQLINRLRYVA